MIESSIKVLDSIRPGFCTWGPGGNTGHRLMGQGLSIRPSLLLKGGVEAKGQGEKARFELPFLFRLS